MYKQRLNAIQRKMRKERTKQWKQARKKQNVAELAGLIFLGEFIKTLLNNKED